MNFGFVKYFSDKVQSILKSICNISFRPNRRHNDGQVEIGGTYKLENLLYTSNFITTALNIFTIDWTSYIKGVKYVVKNTASSSRSSALTLKKYIIKTLL